MGDRGQVHILDQYRKSKGVWLYTHWGATDLVKDVHRALSKRCRWDDDEYLARIIFDEMIPVKYRGTETGWGIGASGPHGDEWRIVEIDCENQKVTVIKYPSSKIEWQGTFEKFIAVDPKDLP